MQKSLLLCGLCLLAFAAGAQQRTAPVANGPHQPLTQADLERVQRAFRPDLVVTNVTCSDLDKGLVSITVRNDGGGAAPASQVSFSVNGSPTGQQGVPALQPQASTTVTIDMDFNQPDLQWTAKADAGQAIQESNENNNIRQGTWTYKP